MAVMDAFAEIAQDLYTLADEIGQCPFGDILNRLERIFEDICHVSASHDLNIDGIAWRNLEEVRFQLQRKLNPRRGRMQTNIPLSALRTYVRFGLKTEEIARIFGVSARTIRRRMRLCGLR